MNSERSLPRPKPVPRSLSTETCTAQGCSRPVSRPGYSLCYDCWRSQTPSSQPRPTTRLSASPSSSPLTATNISEKLGLQRNKVNPILTELGLLNKEQNGWIATPRGKAFGAEQRQNAQTGNFYVVWSESILTNQIFIATIENLKAEISAPANSNIQEQTFRDRFRDSAKFCTDDRHWVRSKAEMTIDNWLYYAGIVHAYERRLPIIEEAYCDFYIPTGKVYIEYWGYENNPEYSERKRTKQRLYQEYELNLIELSDEHIRNLDDYLPQMLLQFGISAN